MEITFYFHPNFQVIFIKVCAWQDSRAVVACTNFCSDMITRINTLQQSFTNIKFPSKLNDDGKVGDESCPCWKKNYVVFDLR